MVTTLPGQHDMSLGLALHSAKYDRPSSSGPPDHRERNSRPYSQGKYSCDTTADDMKKRPYGELFPPASPVSNTRRRSYDHHSDAMPLLPVDRDARSLTQEENDMNTKSMRYREDCRVCLGPKKSTAGRLETLWYGL